MSTRLSAATMDPARWQTLRALFDAVCELPREQWERALHEHSDDPALIAEAMALLDAQTISFNSALQPLGELMGTLADTELQVGERLGQWQLVEKLGAGGMGAVFVAERADELFQQRVAIKLLHVAIASPAVAQRMAQERQILAELQHPNIARLFDGGTTPAGYPYLVMEYIAGLPLDQHCDTKKLALRERLQLFMRVCHGVQAAHQRLIVHCDLKPSNILVRDEVAPVLLDFGIAQVLGDADGGNHGFCTPAYASPEQLGNGRVSIASDVFSLGVLFTELLAMCPLRRDVGDRDRPVLLPSRAASDACAWRQQLRGDLDAIAAKACALDPEQRYPSAAAMAQDIERYLQHRPVEARERTAGYLAGRFLRRHWRGATVTAAVIALTAGFIVSLIEQRRRAEQEAATALAVSDFLVAAFDTADPRMRGAQAGKEPSARDVLDLGAARIDADLSGSPAILARLRLVLGRAYKNLGQPQRAQALLDRAAQGFLDPGVDRPEFAIDALNELSVLFVARQDGAQAVKAARRALALAEREGQPGQIANAHDALGLALALQGDFAQGERALRRAIELRGDSPAAQAASLHNLAQLYRQRGDLDLAERSFRGALALRRKHALPAVDVQASLYGLAMAHFAQGESAQAKPYLIENLALAHTLYGEDSDKLANGHVDLANVVVDLGDYTLAGEHYRSALAIAARVAGADSLEYARIQNNYSTLEYARGDFDTAARLSRNALAIRRARLGDDEKRALRTEAMLGMILARAGRLQEAEPLVERPLAVWLSRYPDDEAGVLAVQLSKVEWLLEGNRLDEAATLLNEAQRGHGEFNAMMVRRIRLLLAELAQRRRDWPRAVAAWREVVALSTQRLGEDSPWTAADRVPYAESLLAAGDVEAAREQARRAGAPLRRELAAQSPLLARLERLRQ